MQSRFKVVRIGVAVVATIGLVAPLWTQAVSAQGDPTCQNINLPVALAPLLLANQTVAGELCTPAAGSQTVDVLVPGATYNHQYWDWPINPELYSYKDKTLQAGRATFNFDRLGTGASSRPLSTSLTLDSDAYVLHQIIGWLKGPQHFGTVDLIGHSLGSGAAISEGATYHDANRIVLTGALHAVGSGANQIPTLFYPATADPQFSGQILDPGYLTTMPGTRGIFYNTGFADPAVIAYDEAHKDVTSATEVAGFADALLPPQLNIARFITANVLSIAGQQDALGCGGLSLDCTNQQAVQANEAAYYTAAASITAVTVPNTGHDLALHTSANDSFNIINQWINSH